MRGSEQAGLWPGCAQGRARSPFAAAVGGEADSSSQPARCCGAESNYTKQQGAPRQRVPSSLTAGNPGCLLRRSCSPGTWHLARSRRSRGLNLSGAPLLHLGHDLSCPWAHWKAPSPKPSLQSHGSGGHRAPRPPGRSQGHFGEPWGMVACKVQGLPCSAVQLQQRWPQAMRLGCSPRLALSPCLPWPPGQSLSAC